MPEWWDNTVDFLGDAGQGINDYVIEPIFDPGADERQAEHALRLEQYRRGLELADTAPTADQLAVDYVAPYQPMFEGGVNPPPSGSPQTFAGPGAGYNSPIQPSAGDQERMVFDRDSGQWSPVAGGLTTAAPNLSNADIIYDNKDTSRRNIGSGPNVFNAPGTGRGGGVPPMPGSGIVPSPGEAGGPQSGPQYTAPGIDVDPRLLLGDSAAGQAFADEQSVEAQRAALRGLQDIHSQGGYTEAERAQLRLAQRNQALQERAQREAILQQAAQRGLSGSGVELQSLMGAQQGSANRGSMTADQIAIAAQQRALQALAAGGQLGSTMRGQSFNEGFQRGSAIDAFNANNVEYTRGVNQRNVDRFNSAQGGAADSQNRSRESQRDAVQQSYGNRLGGFGVATGQGAGLADFLGRTGQQQEQRNREAIRTSLNLLTDDDD